MTEECMGFLETMPHYTNMMCSNCESTQCSGCKSATSTGYSWKATTVMLVNMPTAYTLCHSPALLSLQGNSIKHMA